MQATTPHSSDDSRHQDGQSEASTSGAPDGGVSTTIVSHTAVLDCVHEDGAEYVLAYRQGA